MADADTQEQNDELDEGVIVERQIDNTWYAAKVIKMNKNKELCDIIYFQDGNVETDVEVHELRVRDEGLSGLPALDSVLEAKTARAQRVMSNEYGDANDKVDTAEATAYIINGLENNVATGTGIRGIRWLRTNEQS